MLSSPLHSIHLLAISKILSLYSLDHADYIRRESCESVGQSTSPIKKKSVVFRMEEVGWESIIVSGVRLLRRWVRYRRKISSVLSGSDVWSTSGPPSIVFNYSFNHGLPRAERHQRCVFPWPPSTSTNYTVDRCRVALTDWPTRFYLFFPRGSGTLGTSSPGAGHDSDFFSSCCHASDCETWGWGVHHAVSHV